MSHQIKKYSTIFILFLIGFCSLAIGPCGGDEAIDTNSFSSYQPDPPSTGESSQNLCGQTLNNPVLSQSGSNIAESIDLGIVLAPGCIVNINNTGSNVPRTAPGISRYIRFNPGSASKVIIRSNNSGNQLTLKTGDNITMGYSTGGVMEWTVDTASKLRYIEIRNVKEMNFSITLEGQGTVGPGIGCGTTFTQPDKNNTNLSSALDFKFVLNPGCTVNISNSFTIKTPRSYPYPSYFYYRMNPGFCDTVTLSGLTGTMAIVDGNDRVLASDSGTLNWSVDTATAERYIRVRAFAHNLSIQGN